MWIVPWERDLLTAWVVWIVINATLEPLAGDGNLQRQFVAAKAERLSGISQECISVYIDCLYSLLVNAEATILAYKISVALPITSWYYQAGLTAVSSLLRGAYHVSLVTRIQRRWRQLTCAKAEIAASQTARGMSAVRCMLS